MIAKGVAGDLVVFGRRGADPYEAIVGGAVEDVLLVLREGKPLYGDAALVDALATGCGDLPVCGVAKRVCLDVVGVSLDAVKQAATTTYPLFFCRGETPASEPSCVPYRDSYPGGTSATDRDGDGIADANDDCPAVFNPARPLDVGKQADVDGDGVGDACDSAPLDAAH